MTAAAPIVKWAGGKAKLAEEIRARFPADPKRRERYVEPFVGGGAVFFAAKPKRAILADSNPDLINLYQQVQERPAAVVNCLELHAAKHSKDYYYGMRKAWNDRSVATSKDGAARAAAFLYLNKACFNGLWRVNQKGDFNVPLGSHGKSGPSFPDAAAIHAASRALQVASIGLADFEDILDTARYGCLVYCDPPYHPLNATSDFTSYAKDGFTSQDQARLAAAAGAAVKRGAWIIISQSDTPFTRELYSDRRIWTIEEVQARRNINSKATKRGKVSELLITGAIA